MRTTAHVSIALHYHTTLFLHLSYNSYRFEPDRTHLYFKLDHSTDAAAASSYRTIIRTCATSTDRDPCLDVVFLQILRRVGQRLFPIVDPPLLCLSISAAAVEH